MGEKTKRLAMVASKGTLDQAYPPLILATTAAAMGWEVGIFFTFYGLDILHKKRLERLQVSPVGNPAMPPPIPAIPMLKVPTLMGALPGMAAVATAMMEGGMGRGRRGGWTTADPCHPHAQGSHPHGSPAGHDGHGHEDDEGMDGQGEAPH